MAETTVYNFPEFRSALSGNDYDVIRLGGDITYSSGGITVPRNKGDILIDGQGFTVTDYSSTSYTNCIRYLDQDVGATTFTIQNAVWSGKNYFGVVHTFDTGNFANFTLVLKNVRYTGPQPVYNRRGTTYYIDSVFNLERNAGASDPQELGEVHHAVIEGNVTVNSQSTSTSVLWFLNPSASLTVAENAVFTVNIPQNYMFYTDGTPPPSMVFKADSVTDIRTQYGLFYAAGTTAHIASSFTLEEGASFTSTQSGRRAAPTFKCRDAFTMEKGSSLYITAENSGTSALMYFAVRAQLRFNDPKSVVLYNNGGRVFEFGGGTTALPNAIHADIELLNLWTAAASLPGAGGFDDPPARALRKTNGSNIVADISANTSTTTAISSNMESGDPGYPVTAANFNVMQARVLSMGRLDLAVDEITDMSSAITGATEPFAGLRTSYGAVTVNGNADAAGAISLPVSPPISAGTDVTVGANWKFLTKYIQRLSIGTVTITHLDALIFKTFFAPYGKGIVKRKDPGWYIEVTDTRTEPGPDWYLYARLPAPMAYELYTLDNALTLNAPASYDIMSDIPVLVGRGSWSGQGAVTRITWPEAEGFFLRIMPDYPYHPGKYVSVLDWEVRIGLISL